ncbi:23S rRNA (cytidine(2498)-2'-O)-methyltransferase RlmM [Denitromonas ohlonensis]|uniref:Ribosomal RNA large subunit methyltransferase M n=2 Tax=Denitromonas TaxID=139331 RepID=A0A558CDG0_9RHOO|nr:23S rRNA (cytidine(2498)-2'-O)-methyltransferase RlmM [Denitromonas ohlonensis]TVO64136.1 23S rRNA (cytidine(2498)-2'-O)-methyltransferase RlmM [Denitromonas ohlonensis]TVO76037.1 23S rRNA (cytidine(2498)-2'-O)-methyltransferase RlmM [Denitromonas ohlonensis]TVT46813.1 MAG: 23S rRNA (cytidine(2498)-2'-O)-methyltransferase RlmM [Denitromonas halophila]TVT73253.1 MAG: 23S rRNA (cytidine(2498)-2'-O)-methyltransferase RlmM [Denitromonas halophila]
MPLPIASALLVQCRPGFEKEVAAELEERATLASIPGRASTMRERDGYVLFQLDEPLIWSEVQAALNWRDLIFARQAWPVIHTIAALPSRDRVTPIVEALSKAGARVSSVMYEYPDTNEGKSRSGFCKRFAGPLENGLAQAGLLRPNGRDPQLQLFFPDETQAWIGLGNAQLTNPWPQGIARLRMPSEAPSRSTLKLAEALMCLLDDKERERWLRPQGKAVDLGAAPGGWSWQLAQRGLYVTAIDNGPMDKQLLAGGMVTHIRADGFTWRPPRAVDWLVCDMVEQPSRIATLMGDWSANKRCRHAIFNLKLPMKQRYGALLKCQDIIENKLNGVPHVLRFKQLYHDREEVTGYLSRTDFR